jgi:pyridoxamine 5'-phosphate oxidase
MNADMKGMEVDPNPVEQIQALRDSLKSLGLLAPMCLSTIGYDGRPRARFVDLKEVHNGTLLFGTDSRSAKAYECTEDRRVCLTAWWERLQVQVRVEGLVTMTDDEISDRIFSERSRSAQALAVISRQSGTLEDLDAFKRDLSKLTEGTDKILRPSHWNVYEVEPNEVEILKFSEDRIHVRMRYVLSHHTWNATRLSP